MRKVTRAALVLAGSAALIGVTTVPSFAVDDTTPVSVAVEGGALAISVPVTTELTPAAPGATSTTTLANTTVDDTRAGQIGWEVTVTLPVLTGTILVNSAAETIPTTGATYTAATATSSGTVSVAAAAPILDVSTAKPSQTATGVHGNNTAVWTATLAVPIPDDALADTFSGTMTQSVS